MPAPTMNDLHDITSLNSYRLNGPERLLNSLNDVRGICASAISGNSDVGEKPLSAWRASTSAHLLWAPLGGPNKRIRMKGRKKDEFEARFVLDIEIPIQGGPYFEGLPQKHRSSGRQPMQYGRIDVSLEQSNSPVCVRCRRRRLLRQGCGRRK